MTNDQMLVVDDTLVLINLSPGHHRIPAQSEDGKPIRRIGAYAINDGNNHIMIEEGIEAVEKQKVRSLELPTTIHSFDLTTTPNVTETVRLWRCFTSEQWETIRNFCIPCADGRFFYSGSLEQLGIEDKLLANFMISWIPEDADVLFCTEKPINMTTDASKEFPCIGLRRRCNSISPLASIAEIICSGKAVRQHLLSEHVADADLRKGTKDGGLPATRLRIAAFASAPIICPGTRELLVLFTFQRGFWSFCSEVPVTYSGQQYHIGCLNQLVGIQNPNGVTAYDRYELAVFSENGLVSDRKMTEDVYAKYLFMSFV